MAPWLKLSTAILDDEKISVIRNLPDGDTLFVLWVGILCLAMKKETDRLYIAEGVPYQDTDLSTVLNIKLDTVRMGLKMFERMGMVAKCNDDGALHVTHLVEHQALSKLDKQRLLTADRVRRYRSRKELPAPPVTRYSVTKALPEEEEEREIEEERKKTKEKRAYAENVRMTEEEYGKLVAKYGEAQVAKLIDKLDAYKLSKGKRYASDYGAIRTWAVDACKVAPVPQQRRVCEACASEFAGTGRLCEKCKQVK